MEIIEDIFKAGKYAEGLGHYFRVAIARILRDKGEIPVIKLIEEIEKRYNIRISYANIRGHLFKMQSAGLIEIYEKDNLRYVKLVEDIEIIRLKGGKKNE